MVCGNIYRYPHDNFEEFFQYLERCLGKLAKENEEMYICGDLNLDLLKIDTDHPTQHFLTYYAVMGCCLIYFNP